MRILLVTPPMTQLNTPYPATAYLMGCLGRHAPDVEVSQADFSIELFLRLYSRAGLEAVRAQLAARSRSRAARASMPEAVAHFLAHADDYVAQVEPVVHF